MWRHIDCKAGRITIPSPKTDRYVGKESRLLPLFPELRHHLEAAKAEAEPNTVYVVAGDHLAKAQGPHGWRSCNLRMAFTRLLKRAGHLLTCFAIGRYSARDTA